MDDIELLRLAKNSLEEYIKVLNGETKDLTGLGLRKIFLSQLEYAMQLNIADKQ